MARAHYRIIKLPNGARARGFSAKTRSLQYICMPSIIGLSFGDLIKVRSMLSAVCVRVVARFFALLIVLCTGIQEESIICSFVIGCGWSAIFVIWFEI